MSSFYSNNLRVLVARKEQSSGIPENLTSVDFDVRVRNPTVTATIEADDEASKYATGDHGEDVAVMGAQSASIEFSVKMSSTNGTTSPKWWKFAEACGCEIKTYENGSSAVIGKALVSVLPNMRNKSKSAFINIGLASVQSRGVIKVNYSMVSDGSVSISVYDLKGGKIAYLPEKIHSKGEHSFSFKASRGFYLLDVRGKSSGKEIKTVEKIFVD